MPYLGKTGEIVETLRNFGEFSFEWRIHYDRIACLAEVPDTLYKSPEFRFCNARWSFMICRERNKYGLTEDVSLILRRKDAGPSKTVKITVGIKGEGSRSEEKKEFSIYDSTHNFYTICQICRRLEAYRLVRTDKFLTITCSLKSDVPDAVRDEENLPIMGEESEVPRKLQGLEELQKSLQNMLRSGDDSDVIIKVQGKEFPAHRALLRARSPVFQAMFTHDMVEKQKGVITMEDCDPDMFPDFLEHVYTGSVEMISPKNVVSLYTASDMYDLKTLKQECTHFMKNNLTVACFCDAITLAVKHGEKELIERATEFFCDNTLEIVKTAEWQIFLKENTTVGNELLIKLLTK